MQKQLLPVGVFDSGVGGASVLKELVRILPCEDFLYLGDSKNAPYGTKSHEDILNHSLACAKYLMDKGIKALVVACNTATSVCIEDLRAKYGSLMPIVGIEPALKPAVEFHDGATVLVMATPLTLKENKFAKLCENYKDRANIIPLPCPGLMELIEAGHISDEVTEEFLRELFEKEAIPTPDSVVLGCTHYPFAADAIRRIFPGTEIYDGGEGTARQLKRLLGENNLITAKTEPGVITVENTLDSAQINNLIKKLIIS